MKTKSLLSMLVAVLLCLSSFAVFAEDSGQEVAISVGGMFEETTAEETVVPSENVADDPTEEIIVPSEEATDDPSEELATMPEDEDDGMFLID